MNLKIIFLLLFPLVAFSQNRIKDTLYGNVRSVREKLIFLDSVRQNYKLFAIEDEYGHFGFTSRKFTQGRFNTFWYSLPYVHYINYYREYNDKNQIISETWYYKDNSFLTKYEFLYDKKGHLIEEKELDKNGKPEIIERWGYNRLDQLSSNISIYDYDNGYSFINYEYNGNGDLIKQESYSEEEKVSIIKHEYDNGRRISTYHSAKKWVPVTINCEKGNFEWQTLLLYEYKYDTQGNKIECTDYNLRRDSPNARALKTTYTYDDHNNRTSVFENNFDQKFLHEYQYDTKNRLTSERYIVNDKATQHSEYFYNGDNLVKLIYTENDRTTTVNFTYKFDSHSNWTEQTKSIDGRPLYVRRREIVYY